MHPPPSIYPLLLSSPVPSTGLPSFLPQPPLHRVREEQAPEGQLVVRLVGVPEPVGREAAGTWSLYSPGVVAPQKLDVVRQLLHRGKLRTQPNLKPPAEGGKAM